MRPSSFEPFVVRLERLGIPYFVTGSTAGIIYGDPRLTNGIDIVVALSLGDILRLSRRFRSRSSTARPRRSSRSKCGAASAATAT